MKLINVLRLQLSSKKKSIGDKIFSLYLRTTAIILALAIVIIIVTSQYRMAFEDTLAIMVMLFALVFVATSVVDRHIINKYFEPLQTLIDDANRITDGKDLSKRISLESVDNQKSELEIVRFTKTFNRMFDRLERSFQHEKQFSRNISHEIKTPLAVIVSTCEYAQDYTDDPEEMQDSLETVATQAKRIADLTAKLSTLSKMDGNDSRLDYERFCLDELVRITADEVLIEYEYLGRNVTVNVHGDTDVTVYADRLMLTRLFINLLSNSIKYGSQDGTTDVYLYRKGDTVECTVSDDGIGISEEDLPNVWEPFFRVDRSKVDSTGLGLPMVKKIVSMHGGRIGVESTLGEGTTFRLVLPIAEQ